MRDFKKITISNCIIELVPNIEKTRWLICFDGYLDPYRFCRKAKLDYTTFTQSMKDIGVYERNGNAFIDDPEIIEPFIVALKLML